MARLTYAKRQGLPKKTFATPPTASAKERGAKGSYPLTDEAHARNALARVSQFGNSEQKAKVRAAVKRRYPGISQSRGATGKR